MITFPLYYYYYLPYYFYHATDVNGALGISKTGLCTEFVCPTREYVLCVWPTDDEDLL